MSQPLREITEGLWESCRAISPGPPFRMDTRMSVVSLGDSELLLHSPVEVDDGGAAAIDALGRVAHLVSPNLFHHLFLPQAIERWPDAKVWGSPGLGDKVGGLRVDESLREGELWPGIRVFEIAGMPKFREFVLFCEPSKTLLVTDLVFNAPVGHNFATRLFFRVFGTYERFAVSKLFKTMIKDKQAFGKSCALLLDLPIERIVMAHGAVCETEAKSLLHAALSPMVT